MSKVLIPFRSNEHGFTLLEMMIVLSIIGTVFALAIPNYLQWNRTYQLRQATTDLHGSLTLARMTAMNRNTTVTMTLGAIPCPPETAYCGTIRSQLRRNYFNSTFAKQKNHQCSDNRRNDRPTEFIGPPYRRSRR